MTILTSGEESLAARAREAAARAAAAAPGEPAPGDHRAEEQAARAALAAVSAAGLVERIVPAAYRSGGGAGSPLAREICVIREALARESALADVMFAMQGLGSFAITLAGSDEVKRRYLPGVASGGIVAAIALTEPGAGSDLAAIATRATADGGGYLLEGTKTFITNAGLADFYTVLARTGDGASGKAGLALFVVEAGAPGLSVKERLTVSAPHPIGTLQFSGCRVPASRRLGMEGEGFDLAMRVLDRFRPTVGAAANGLARRALDESLHRVKERRQFGRPLAEFQAIRFKLADMATWLEAARLLVMRAASLLDALPGPEATREDRSAALAHRASSMAKLYATEAAQRIIDETVQIHGGLGVTRGQIVERLYREVRALRIYEGTSEIQRSIIARSILQG